MENNKHFWLGPQEEDTYRVLNNLLRMVFKQTEGYILQNCPQSCALNIRQVARKPQREP